MLRYATIGTTVYLQCQLHTQQSQNVGARSTIQRLLARYGCSISVPHIHIEHEAEEFTTCSVFDVIMVSPIPSVSRLQHRPVSTDSPDAHCSSRSCPLISEVKSCSTLMGNWTWVVGQKPASVINIPSVTDMYVYHSECSANTLVNSNPQRKLLYNQTKMLHAPTDRCINLTCTWHAPVSLPQYLRLVRWPLETEWHP